ncbi:alkaline shock response membrane anchor protein AmaP [Lutispora thermophila]|uniref:Uncharacterized conserved protein YloU, alkaline shock protein (Asp23) family n=1 Tax=Lutispora thermophila DSM 19022 TaxID=1122184 RepID=A0A1M6F577_9FIRM|nr:alkaline shock response membrane anchor protein AmaP [Lutispora thermophila]SHI92857.1 Uncharacterized conserved protein YloU, alkaline shock protein (Asp23) family [Lutispora thermophila DSM 19022]
MLDRLLLLIFSVIVAIFSFALVLLALPFMPSQYSEALHLFIFESNSMILIAIILMLIALRFIFKTTEQKINNVNYISKETEIGEIRISFNTIKSIALSSIKNINEVKDVKAQVNDKNGEVSIIITACFLTGAVIPDVSKDIQNRVKEYIETTVEVKVKEVIVFVEEANNSSKRRVG